MKWQLRQSALERLELRLSHSLWTKLATDDQTVGLGPGGARAQFGSRDHNSEVHRLVSLENHLQRVCMSARAKKGCATTQKR